MTVLLSNSNDHPVPDHTLRANNLAQLITAEFAFTYWLFHNLIAYTYPPPAGIFLLNHICPASLSGVVYSDHASSLYFKPYLACSSTATLTRLVSKKERLKIAIELYSAVLAYLYIQVFVPLFLYSHSRFEEASVCVANLSCWPPLFVATKETVCALYPSLFCAHLLHFPSIPPHGVLSLLILPINDSAQSLPPSEAMSPPPQEMNDWQVCSVSNIHPDKRRQGKWLDFFTKEKLQKTKENEIEWRTADRGNHISNTMACFSSWKHLLFLIVLSGAHRMHTLASLSLH